DKLRSRVES
ncbi:hypothetical protein A2U01_0093708, partial [Trifolium medium]|nr:hypothetical protein [Trifolium medium]